MDFEPISDDTELTFGQGRGKSRTTVLAEDMILKCVEAQEGPQKAKGIELRSVGVTTKEVDGATVEVFDEAYFKAFWAALKTAATNLNVTVNRSLVTGRPHSIAITVKDRQAPPAHKANGATKSAATKKVAAKK